MQQIFFIDSYCARVMQLEDYKLARLKELLVQYETGKAHLIRNEQAHQKFMASGDFSLDEHRIAIAAIRENVLQNLAWELQTAFENQKSSEGDVATTETGTRTTEQALRSFSAAYNLFPKDRKHELLPLFFCHDLKTKTLIFFNSDDSRDHYFSAFKSLLELDSISISTIESAYLDDPDSKFVKLFPMYDKILALTSRLS